MLAGSEISARMGLIVNPIAGMGGRVGLKGTDGAEILAEARVRGARPDATDRAARAISRLARLFPGVEILTGTGALGEDAVLAAGLPCSIAFRTTGNFDGATTAADTVALAEALERAGVSLILVTGGDGTARDVFSAVNGRVPILGVPAGVKMHSALFARSPESAGDVAAHYLAGNSRARLADAEVMDIDEESVRGDRVSARLFGYCRTPFERALIQGPKSGAIPGDDEAVKASARELVAEMQPGTVYLLGPGTTTLAVSRLLGLPASLLGCDAVLDGASIGTDLDEKHILELVRGRDAKLVVGIVGGQGCLFGRGNQQFSADVIHAVGRDNIIVIAGVTKLAALSPGRLFVDTGDPRFDQSLAGFIAVRTGPRQTAMMRVDA